MNSRTDQFSGAATRGRRRLVAGLVGAIAVCGLWASSAHPQPWADYGDAPDPRFPSKFASFGPLHLDVTKEWIGTGRASDTTVENDSWQVDLDPADHGGCWFERNGGTWFMTRVSYDPVLSNPDDNRFLNVLADLNGDGIWDGNGVWGPPEWVVQNLELPFEWLPPGENTLTVQLKLADEIDPADMDDRYTRVTLSNVPAPPVPDGAWDVFERGETEDWLGIDGILGPAKPAPTLTTLKGQGVCNVCGHPHCRGLPVCPQHADDWPWILAIPPGASVVRLEAWVETAVGCINSLCGHTQMLARNQPGGRQVVAGGINPAVGAKPIGNIIPGLFPAIGGGPARIDFGLHAGLVLEDGHARARLRWAGVFDPDEEYIYMSNEFDRFGDDSEVLYAVPEPGTVVVLLVGVSVLVRRRRR